MSRKSSDMPGEDGHLYVSSAVNRSSKLKCQNCGKLLPMGTSVVFELDDKERFVTVYCNNDECTPEHYDEADDRHTFDLED